MVVYSKSLHNENMISGTEFSDNYYLDLVIIFSDHCSD